MKGPAGTVRFITEHGAVGHLGPDHAALEVWTGSAWVPVLELLDLLRDVVVDWVPPCDREDGACECSANRARRYLRAGGVEL